MAASTIITLFLASSLSSTSASSLEKVMEKVQPYLQCRLDRDKRIVALQQQLRDKIADGDLGSSEEAANYYGSSPLSKEIIDLDNEAEMSCNLKKYVGLIVNEIGEGGYAYDDQQKKHLVESIIYAFVRSQQQYLNYKTGAYRFPLPIVEMPPMAPPRK
ncbi:MAG: hypothetical protein J7498_12955 [Sphingobium sp.]|nr:hypothetical protein [Sphingobium sp.]